MSLKQSHMASTTSSNNGLVNNLGIGYTVNANIVKRSKPVIWVYCKHCEKYGYFNFNIHKETYCTTYETNYFDYRSIRERAIIRSNALNTSSHASYMAFFNFMKK